MTIILKLRWLIPPLMAVYLVYAFFFSDEGRNAQNYFYPSMLTFLGGLAWIVGIMILFALLTSFLERVGTLYWLYRINDFADWFYEGETAVASGTGASPIRMEGVSLAAREVVVLLFVWVVLSWLANIWLPGTNLIKPFSAKVLIVFIVGVLTIFAGVSPTGKDILFWRTFILTAIVTLIVNYTKPFGFNPLGLD